MHGGDNELGNEEVRMVSVGGGAREVGGDAPKKANNRILIAPTDDSMTMDARIIDNLGEIQSGQKKKIGVFGTSKASENHKQMIELLTYALVLSGNHVFTSGGATGTNIAVIRGALRACNIDLLTVILPQSLLRQPPETQALLARVGNLIERPEWDELDFRDAAVSANEDILSCVKVRTSIIYRPSPSYYYSVSIFCLFSVVLFSALCFPTNHNHCVKATYTCLLRLFNCVHL
jgi:hypothetical protein